MSHNKLSPDRKIPASFSEGLIDGATLIPLRAYTDQRGWLVELYREDQLDTEIHPVMSYISQTFPGVSRGPHEHVYQTDYFAFIGPGDFTLYLWDIRADSPTWGNRVKAVVGASNKQAAIVPPGVVHAYKNTGNSDGWVINLPNQLYAGTGRKQPVDEIRHEDIANSPFILD